MLNWPIGSGANSVDPINRTDLANSVDLTAVTAREQAGFG
jgi:hypothetical protein